jgi:DNA-binding MarR family transcriptional regulator
MELTLFDNPKPYEVVETDTKRESYNKIRVTVSSKREQVYGVIASCGPITQRQIAERLGWEVHCVNGRVSELEKAKFIEQRGTAYDPIRHRTVKQYGVKTKADS